MADEAKVVPGSGRTVAWLSRQLEHVLAEKDLSSSQYRILALLAERPEVASALADKLTVSRPSITTVVDGLVARGLVERGTDAQDRRRVTHAVTAKGELVLQEADEAIEEMLAALFGELDAAGNRSAVAGIGALTRMYQAHLAAWQPPEPGR